MHVKKVAEEEKINNDEQEVVDKGTAAAQDVDENEVIENERFNRQFNKQLELQKDQVPGVISEFIQNAYNFIKK